MTKKYHSITVRQAAREAGVSVATVSRCINRIHAVVRNLASKKTRVIGLLPTNMHTKVLFYEGGESDT